MTTTEMSKPRAPLSRRWLIAGIAIIIIAIVAGVVVSGSRAQSNATSTQATVAVERGTIIASTTGSGTIAAAQALDLTFTSSGTVIDVLVEEGDRVMKGETLAQLDTRDLELQVANAQSQLEDAKLRLTQSQSGNVTTQELDAQQAQVRSAEAQLASAQAQLRSAQSQLNALRNPSASDVQAAQIKVQTAELSLQSTRDSKSIAKNRAQLDLSRAVQSLTQAQSSYSTAFQNWQHIQDEGTDPTNPTKTEGTKVVPNKVNDAQRQSYYDKFIQAEASLRSAEAAVQQSQLAYDQARQDEITSIEQAQVNLADAQRNLNALLQPNRNDITRQQASVDQANASLQQAQAGLDQAKANLAKLNAPQSASDIDLRELTIAQAEQSLQQSQLKLDQATLRAPFDGIISKVNIVPGSIASSAQTAISLLDRSQLHVDLTLSENDVATVQLAQPVALSIDALKDWSEQGLVDYIAPAAEVNNGVVTYRVRVTLPDNDQRVKVGMTANLIITTETKANVLRVPNSTLLPKGAGRAVQMLNADGTSREVDVQTGLTDGSYTEVTSGLNEGDQVVTEPGAAPTRSGGILPVP